MMEKRKTISFAVDEIEYEKINAYAKAKGHGGQFPASTFAHYATFQMMKKYPLSGAEIREIEAEDTARVIPALRLYSLTLLEAKEKGDRGGK